MTNRQHIIVYVAGPFRGPHHYAIHENICRAEAVALTVWQSGFTAISPHLNTAHFQDAAPDEVWLNGDLEILRRCDAVLVVPNWEHSKGTRAEIEFAEAIDIPVFYALADLVAQFGTVTA